MSNNVEKAEKALKSALAHAGVSHIQDNRVFNAIDKLVEAKVEARTEALRVALVDKDAHLKRETDLVSKAIAGGSEVFMKLGEGFVLDPEYVANYILSRRQEYSEVALKNMKEKQNLQARITELKNSIREIRKIANNDGVEIGTVGERVCERVEDICHSMIGAPTSDDING